MEAHLDTPDTFESAPATGQPVDGRSPEAPRPGRNRQHHNHAEGSERAESPTVTEGVPPKRAVRDGELWLLARRARGAALRVDLDLQSSLVRQVFRRDFVYVSRLLHALESSRRVQGLDRACLDDALAALQRRAADAQALLERIKADVEASMAARGHAQAQVTFARSTRFQATVVSPAAHGYLALLIRADATLAQLERAWLLGMVDPATRAALVGECRRALHGYKDLAGDRRAFVGHHVRQVNAQRRQATKVVDAGIANRSAR